MLNGNTNYYRTQYQLPPIARIVTTATNSIVSVGTCPGCDIQVNIERPGSNTPIVRWFDFDKLNKEMASAWRLLIHGVMANHRKERSAQAVIVAKTTMPIASATPQAQSGLFFLQNYQFNS
ncbi:MAG: hypothetical protein PVJ39_12665 [Gammaproteobacteria bacterium]|jgi:hypothetical protein